MMIPGVQFETETESVESSKRCRELFAPYQQDLYVVSHSPDGTFPSHDADAIFRLNKLGFNIPN